MGFFEKREMLLLPSCEGWDQDSALSSLSGYPCQKSIEPAGISYEKLMQKLAAPDSDEEVDDQKITEESSSQDAEYEAKFHKKDHTLRAHEEDLYELLGLGDVRHEATDDQIKKAYRVMVLKYHPDKMESNCDELFKKIQNAYDVLTDPRKRRDFDSQDDFDDSIPSDNWKKEGDDFFQVFGPYFRKFARWSVVQPMPKIGDENTPYSDVEQFYSKWAHFKSWRSYNFLNEFNIEDAECREERRWMERKNAAMQKEMKRNEKARVNDLIDLAEKYDPRVKAHQQALLEKRNRAKELRKQSARKKYQDAEDAARKAAEEALQVEKEKALEIQRNKSNKEKNRKIQQKARSKLRQACKAALEEAYASFEETVEEFCRVAQPENLTSITALINESPEKVQELVADALSAFKAAGGQVPAASPKPKENTAKVWTDNDVSTLAKAIARYPPGTNNRWNTIANEVPGFTTKQIISKTKEIQATTDARKDQFVKTDDFEKFKNNKKGVDREIAPPDQRLAAEDPLLKAKTKTDSPLVGESLSKAADWTGAEQKLLEVGLKNFPSSDKERWGKIASTIPNRSKKDCMMRYKYIVSMLKAKKG